MVAGDAPATACYLYWHQYYIADAGGARGARRGNFTKFSRPSLCAGEYAAPPAAENIMKIEIAGGSRPDRHYCRHRPNRRRPSIARKWTRDNQGTNRAASPIIFLHEKCQRESIQHLMLRYVNPEAARHLLIRRRQVRPMAAEEMTSHAHHAAKPTSAKIMRRGGMKAETNALLHQAPPIMPSARRHHVASAATSGRAVADMARQAPSHWRSTSVNIIDRPHAHSCYIMNSMHFGVTNRPRRLSYLAPARRAGALASALKTIVLTDFILSTQSDDFACIGRAMSSQFT